MLIYTAAYETQGCNNSFDYFPLERIHTVQKLEQLLSSKLKITNQSSIIHGSILFILGSI